MRWLESPILVNQINCQFRNLVNMNGDFSFGWKGSNRPIVLNFTYLVLSYTRFKSLDILEPKLDFKSHTLILWYCILEYINVSNCFFFILYYYQDFQVIVQNLFWFNTISHNLTHNKLVIRFPTIEICSTSQSNKLTKTSSLEMIGKTHLKPSKLIEGFELHHLNH